MISQTTQWVECRRLNAPGLWETVIYRPGDQVRLNSIDLDFAIADLYRGLDP